MHCDLMGKFQLYYSKMPLMKQATQMDAWNGGVRSCKVRFYSLLYLLKQTKCLTKVTVLIGSLTALLEYFDLNLQINANYKFLN